jgi:hypothetical protein
MGWTGETVFELCNGQVWLQASYAYSYDFAYRPNVTIVPTNAGYLLLVDGVQTSIYVTPVTQFIKTCIASDFTGWQAGSYFEMCNGQVWQQTSATYSYHYAYRPHALLYATPSGVKLYVDGMSDSVSVR